MDEIQPLLNEYYALICALVKIYDNYETPLKANVKCWKYKYSKEFFVVGMTIKKFDFRTGSREEQIGFCVPMRYWDKIKVIELKELPPNSDYTSEDVVNRLLSL